MSRFCLFEYLQFVKFALLCLVVNACFVSSTDSIFHLQVHVYLIQQPHDTWTAGAGLQNISHYREWFVIVILTLVFSYSHPKIVYFDFIMIFWYFAVVTLQTWCHRQVLMFLYCYKCHHHILIFWYYYDAHILKLTKIRLEYVYSLFFKPWDKDIYLDIIKMMRYQNIMCS